MKPILLMMLGALALAGSVYADNPQVVIHSTHAEEDARAAARFEANEPQTYESLYHRIAKTRQPSKVEQMYKEWLEVEWLKNHQKPAKLIDGDHLALSNQYDDVATIRTYLHDSGYALSDAQILKVQDYMKANGIKHVSEVIR